MVICKGIARECWLCLFKGMCKGLYVLGGGGGKISGGVFWGHLSVLALRKRFLHLGLL